MKEIITKYPHLLHGGDYNPEQWIDCPKVLEEDIRLMKEAHVNCVSLGIFSWAKLEPEEGEFHFGWLRRIIDHLFENGIYTILATPTGAMPHWMTAKYEEVRQMGPDGVRNLPGRRHNFCYTSPVMRKKMKKINHELSRHLGNHPGVILWHISNEYGGNGSDASCHCPHCQQAFREWLKEKYKTLDNLNHAWWTTFWSHTYTDWSQIHSPVPNGENGLHGLNLDWKRFVSHQIQDFCKEEIHAVLKYSVLPVTINMMEFFKPLDYFKFAPQLDIISWDSYPEWHSKKDEVDTAVRVAACHTLMRSLKKAPFLLMESTPSIVNWKPVNTQKRPGLHELSSRRLPAAATAYSISSGERAGEARRSSTARWWITEMEAIPGFSVRFPPWASVWSRYRTRFIPPATGRRLPLFLTGKTGGLWRIFRDRGRIWPTWIRCWPISGPSGKWESMWISWMKTAT